MGYLLRRFRAAEPSGTDLVGIGTGKWDDERITAETEDDKGCDYCGTRADQGESAEREAKNQNRGQGKVKQGVTKQSKFKRQGQKTFKKVSKP